MKKKRREAGSAERAANRLLGCDAVIDGGGERQRVNACRTDFPLAGARSYGVNRFPFFS
jgi:hypothetical protein